MEAATFRLLHEAEVRGFDRNVRYSARIKQMLRVLVEWVRFGRESAKSRNRP